ncbi:MAG TPA: four helix bundle protein [Longimicrobiaceae bacterium]
MRHNAVLEKSYAYALAAVRLYRRVQARKEFVLSRQLARSATSVGANVEEAIAAQSRRDFVSKMSIARKEARESRYWLRLMYDADIASREETGPLLTEADELIRMLTAIILSTEANVFDSDGRDSSA